MITIPIDVIGQILQYWRYLKMVARSEGVATDKNIDLQAFWLSRKDGVKTASLGFCGGLLAAFAVASSRTQQELEKHAATVLRLSLLMGILADADEARHGRFELLTTVCRQKQQTEQMQRIVHEVSPEGHIQANFDIGCATVCAPVSTISVLLERLRAAGIKTSKLGIRPRIHNPGDENHRQLGILLKLCEQMPGLRLPDASQLAITTYNNAGGMAALSQGGLHEIAARGILTEQCDWYRTFMAVHKRFSNPVIVSFGDQCVPRSMIPEIGYSLLPIDDMERAMTLRNNTTTDPIRRASFRLQGTDNRNQTNGSAGTDAEATIAVVGMAIQVAGADELDEFANLLRSGQSQHQRIGPDRMKFGTSDGSRQWYANFMRDIDAFDHQFFNCSPRESRAMDPQQRRFLQAVYQALEHAGYFASAVRPGKAKTDVGVYVGCSMNDYEHHVVGHSPSVFTATGPKSYIPSRVSHFFGWTGPAVVYGTLCSSSMVALHAACQGLLAGECSAAVAGGVNIMTHPHTFRAMAAANFLSPTGQCKPFDEGADGFCRGEASGCVYLKRMSDALRDGDRIVGAIRSTTVSQNQNLTPSFVPNCPSLSQLYSDAIRKAKVDVSGISVIEAHGTGTSVGDAAEYQSIQQVFDGSCQPDNPRLLGSVKGHVGHTEAASGILSLIKILVMMQDDFIPPQASFSKLSGHLTSIPGRGVVEIPTTLRIWPDDRPRTALIGNYGATGANVAVVVTEPSTSRNVSKDHLNAGHVLPFWIAGRDKRSITTYCARLTAYLQSHPSASLADISLHVSLQSNRNLPQRILFTSQSRQDLEQCLQQLATGVTTGEKGNIPQITALGVERPVVLCFGGQTGRYIGLQRSFYESISIFRHPLDECDVNVQAAGQGSIYPAIFSNEPIPDLVQLQALRFSMQYACARSWLDCGLSNRVVAVVGYSFGEIAALCIAGGLTLLDAAQLVVNGARLVVDQWGDDPGTTLMIEADEATVNRILAEAQRHHNGDHHAAIACYNSPRLFTLAGSTVAMDAVSSVCRKTPGVKSHRLDIPYAFHCTLVDPLQDGLDKITKGLSLKDPIIRHERATETPDSTPFNAWEQMRNPVYFCHAIQRLAESLTSCVWLEAGSGSGVTSLASQAVGPHTSPHSFHSLSITGSGRGVDGLVATTMSLWRDGIPATFWSHHPSQTPKVRLSLPAYPFEKSRYWLDLNLSHDEPFTGSDDSRKTQGLGDLVQSVGDREEIASQGQTRASSSQYFAIDTDADLYKELLHAHVLNKTTPVLPAAVQIGLAIHALSSIHPQWASDRLQPTVLNMTTQAPIVADI
ncbi:hypothetical protein FE257_008223 [Aspergillus nanangensis]|uniref:Ketosynthase family 3 (KS3) domain-containing protein n=1 Tax=Aspergillus nanangensis TaxID=2582783 RepID=A0AAD4GSU2_ASPNN|nr:hypothetical protein FE257_008223 [Aspergillus nanangensis]